MIVQHPLFFFGLVALSIPIIVHLFNFRRFKKVYFSSIQFLKKIEFDTNKQSKLKKWLVLACRCLAILFLVLAFVQPLITANKQNIGAGRKAISIFIDNSFSMNAIGDELSLLESAKRAAKDIVKNYDNRVRFQIITNDLSGKQQHLLTKEDALNELEYIDISAASPSIQDIFKRQQMALQEVNGEKKMAYFLSDFQKSQGVLKNDPAFDIYIIPFNNEKKQNVYIDTCWFEEPLHQLNQTGQLFVRVKNSGENNYESVRLTCEINGQIKSITDFSIESKSTITDTIVFKYNQVGWNKVKLGINDFPIVFDDNYFTAFEVINKLKILHIYDQLPNKFVTAAYANQEVFDYRAEQVNALSYAAFKNYHLIVVEGVKSFSSGLQSELNKYVASNRNLVVAPAAEVDLSSYNQFMGLMQLNSLAAVENEPTVVMSVNRQEKTFSDVFSQWNNQMDLPTINTYFRMDRQSRVGIEPLMEMKNNLPLVVKYPGIKRGDIYFINCPLNKEAGGLPYSSFFAPMLYKMAISGRSAEVGAVNLGAKANIMIQPEKRSSEEERKGKEVNLKIKTNREEIIPGIVPMGNELQITINESIKEAGFADLTNSDNQVELSLGFNYNRKESLLSYYQLDELKEIYKAPNVHFVSEAKENIGKVAKQLESGLPIWKYCLLFTLIFLLAEALIIRFWDKVIAV